MSEHISQLELIDPTSSIQTSLQRSLQFVSFGLQASKEKSSIPMDIPGVFMKLYPAGEKTTDIDTIQKEFHSWVISNGIRDCIDTIGPSLEWARKICYIWSMDGIVSENPNGSLHLAGKIFGQDWNIHIGQEAASFDYYPLRKKIEHLSETYGFTKPELSDAILSINNVRNCLTHRNGIVGEADIKEETENSMMVCWRKIQLSVSGKEDKVIIDSPIKMNAGDLICCEMIDTGKRFALGERIIFTPQEFVEISTTFLLFALQIQQSIIALQRNRFINQSINL